MDDHGAQACSCSLSPSVESVAEVVMTDQNRIAEALKTADESDNEQGVVNAVLAFQRWRNVQLKGTLQQKVLKVAQKATLAEEEVHRRDYEIRRLQQRIRILEDEARRIDETKDTNIALLQKDKVCALAENKIVLDQLARKDQEVIKLTRELENLQAKLSQLCDSQTTLQTQVHVLTDNNKATIHSLQRKVECEKIVKEIIKVSLCQELRDMQALLLKSFSALKLQVAGKNGDVVSAVLQIKETNQKRLLSLFWDVCSKLATALVEAREKFSIIIAAGCSLFQKQVDCAQERKTNEEALDKVLPDEKRVQDMDYQ